MTSPIPILPDTQSILQRAQDELATTGITSEQRQGYIPRLSELFYRHITPFSYGAGEQQIIDNLSNIAKEYFTGDTTDNKFPSSRVGGKEVNKYGNAETPIIDKKTGEKVGFNSEMATSSPEQEDSWRLYLGLPQKNRTFGISDYIPGNAKDIKPYFKINGFWDNLLSSHLDDLIPDSFKYGQKIHELQTQGDSAFKGLVDEKKHQENINKFYALKEEVTKASIKHLSDAIDRTKNGKLQLNDDRFGKGVLAHFQLTKGQDEKGPYLAYYDIWDLHVPGAKYIGKPYEVYDRLYYDPKTFKPIDPKGKGRTF